VLRPKEPFQMRTRDYRLYAHPGKGTLSRAVIRRGYWEPFETEVFKRLLIPGALVIDAGANFGHYALTAANAIGPNGRVIAFEPHPETFSMLEANRTLLPFDNLIAIPAGLGSKNGTMEIHTDFSNPGGHSFFDWNLRKGGGGAQAVSILTLDSYLSEREKDRRVEIIKIDVQGFEMEVLRGAAQTIEHDHPTVFCEVTPEALQRAGSSVKELLGFFQSRSYHAAILLNNPDRMQSMEYAEMEAFFSHTSSEYHDVLFSPKFG